MRHSCFTLAATVYHSVRPCPLRCDITLQSEPTAVDCCSEFFDLRPIIVSRSIVSCIRFRSAPTSSLILAFMNARNGDSSLPRNVSAAVEFLLARLSKRQADQIRGTAEGHLIDLHFGYGIRVRQILGLWRGNEELMRDCGAFDADTASIRIIQVLWVRLQQVDDQQSSTASP